MELFYTETTFVNNIKKKNVTEKEFLKDVGNENGVINVHPQVTYQTWEGFGGAFTDSAGYVYSLMNDEDKNTMIDKYYKKEELNYVFGRIHMDSCDFSTEQYEAMSDANDVTMESFNIGRTAKYILPLVHDVQNRVGREIDIMVSPWSPPAFMKTNNERSHGGKLKPEYHKMWAEYICRYIKELRKEGCRVVRMSLQNEPAATQTWDSCVYTAQEEKEFLRDYMYPALVENNLEDIEIFVWDHNKERLFERACTIIDDETDKMVAGLAFHWYSGDHFEALEMVKQKFPDKKLILSEACIEYSKFSQDDYLKNAQKYGHDIIGNMNNGMNAFYDWNILLDEQGGPNHVGNFCDAPYLYDTKNKKLMERNTLSYIWHFSHFINPGAKRIGYSKYTAKLDVTAFKNPDGSIAVVIMNDTDEAREANIRMNDEIAEITIAPQAIGTVLIK